MAESQRRVPDADAITVFILSLDVSPQGQTSLSPQLSDVRVFPAIDARLDRGAETEAWCADNDVRVSFEAFARHEGWVPTPTQLACAVGHHMIYREIVREGLPYALILEQDALQVGDISSLAYAVPLLSRPDVPTIVQLSCRGEIFAHPSDSRALRPCGVVPLSYPPRQTTAYLINLAAAREAASAPLDGLADWPSFATLVDFYALIPWSFTESGTGTTIQVAPRGGSRSRRFRPDWRWLPLQASGQYLYRVYLPRVDAWLWRARRRPRVGCAGEIWRSSIPRPLIAAVRGIARREQARSSS